MRNLFTQTRYLVLIAVAGLSATALATFCWSVVKSGQWIIDLFDTNAKDSSGLVVVGLLEVIDTYLLAVVQLIVVIGLYELFIGSLDVPDWLHAKSLEDLKKSIIDVFIVFLGVKGIEGLLKREDPSEALTFSLAVAVLIISLTFFRLQGSIGKRVKSPE